MHTSYSRYLPTLSLLLGTVLLLVAFYGIPFMGIAPPVQSGLDYLTKVGFGIMLPIGLLAVASPLIPAIVCFIFAITTFRHKKPSITAKGITQIQSKSSSVFILILGATCLASGAFFGSTLPSAASLSLLAIGLAAIVYVVFFRSSRS